MVPVAVLVSIVLLLSDFNTLRWRAYLDKNIVIDILEGR